MRKVVNEKRGMTVLPGAHRRARLHFAVWEILERHLDATRVPGLKELDTF